MNERHGIARELKRAVLVRGPGGRNLCRWCQTEVAGRRRTFCSDKCVEEWVVRSSQARARALVEKRDHGICAVCAVNTERIRRILDMLHRRVRAVSYVEDHEPLGGIPYRGFKAVPAWSPGWALARQRRAGELLAGWIGPVRASTYASRLPHLWEMDHVVPVAEGGGSCGLDNLRTLCLSCHMRVTRELRARLGKARRAAR